MIHRKDGHLPWRWLADRADGTLAPDLVAAADEHLASGCRPCAARDRSVRRMVAAIGCGPLERPPAAADRRVLALLPRLRAALRPPADVMVGTLVLDRRADLALATRAAGADVRHLLWTVGDLELDATVVADGGASDLLGQVVRADDRTDAADVTGEVRAMRGVRAAASSSLACDGRFTFRGLPSGAYVIEGDLDGRAFVLPLLVLDG